MNEEKGKNQILATATVVLGIELLINLIGVVVIGYNWSFLFQLLITGIVFKFLYDGNEWARIAIIFLLAIACIGGILYSFRAVFGLVGLGIWKGVLNIIFNVIVTIANGFGLYVTACSPTIKNYTKSHM